MAEARDIPGTVGACGNLVHANLGLGIKTVPEVPRLMLQVPGATPLPTSLLVCIKSAGNTSIKLVNLR